MSDTALPFSIFDSLQKYSGKDSLYLQKHDSAKVEGLLISKANNFEFGIRTVYQDTTSFIVLYQRIQNLWQATDTVENPSGGLCSVSRIDLNGDQQQDIRISTPDGAHGNCGSIVFLFDPKTHFFKHNTFYDLENVEFDTLHKFVRSPIYASAAGCQDKMKYKIVADSLVFDMGIEYCPDDTTPSDRASIEFYRMRNGNRAVTKRLSGQPDKLWKIFTTTFWNSSQD